MHHRAKDLTGLRHGFLVITGYAGSNGKKSLYHALCDCGATKIIAGSEFQKGRTRSCGCKKAELQAASHSTHGMSRHPAYHVWRSMRDRCSLPTHQAWENYGGRGIDVCPEWADFETFWRDMGPSYQTGLTIERKDVNGNYCKANCVWATWKEQANNRRNSRTDGIGALSEIFGIPRSTIDYRIQHGVTDPLELIAPPNPLNRFTIS